MPDPSESTWSGAQSLAHSMCLMTLFLLWENRDCGLRQCGAALLIHPPCWQKQGQILWTKAASFHLVRDGAKHGSLGDSSVTANLKERSSRLFLKAPLRKLCSPSLSLQLSSSFAAPRDPLVLARKPSRNSPSWPGPFQQPLCTRGWVRIQPLNSGCVHSSLPNPPRTISLFFPLPVVPTETQGQLCFQAPGRGRV